MDTLHFNTRIKIAKNKPIQVNVVDDLPSAENITPLIAHELKNPLTSIRGYTELILSGATGPITPDQHKYLLTILSNVQRMSLLVADLADTEKIESGHLSLDLRSVSFNQALDEVMLSARPLIEEKNLKAQVDLPDEPVQIMADYNRLAQILTNLVSNAIKYTPEGGLIEIRAEKEHPLDPDAPKGLLHVRIVDSGIGISEENQKKIFQKYFRAQDDQIRGIPGTGLGLYITKMLVNMHHGQIWIDSEAGKGSTFHFTVPLA
jgi:signal transduction histidine kinase